MTIDWNKVSTLLDVIHKAAEAGPAYAWFAAQADAELSSIRKTFDKPPAGGGIIRPAVAPEEE